MTFRDLLVFILGGILVFAPAAVLPPSARAGMYGDLMTRLRRQYCGDSLTIRLGGMSLAPNNPNVVALADADSREGNFRMAYVSKAIYDRYVKKCGVPQAGDRIIFRGAWVIEIKDKGLVHTTKNSSFKTKHYEVSYVAYFRANQMQLLQRGKGDAAAPAKGGEPGEDVSSSLHSAEAEEEKAKAAAARIAVGELQKRMRSFAGKHFLVYYSGEVKYAEDACRYFDTLAEKFQAVVSSLNLALHPPPEKLVAVIFKDYRDYAATTGIESWSCPGFFSWSENALYVYDYRTHPAYKHLAGHAESGTGGFDADGLRVSGTGLALRAASWMRQMKADVMIHEAAHQLCYNTGFFAQTGNVYPTWLVEGSAQYFEHPSYWDFHDQPAGNINAEALQSFREGLALGRFIPLKELLVPAEGFFLSHLDRVDLAYGESWALFHYLMHGEGGRYRPCLGRYIAHLNETKDGKDLSAGEKIVLFRRFFQVEPLVLEKQWLEYVQGLKEESIAIPKR